MKKKAVVILLVAVAVCQLLFPLSFIAYEKVTMNAVIEKGASYTLEYTRFYDFDKNIITLNTDDWYTVGYVWDKTKLIEYEDYIPNDTLSMYNKVVINEKEDGTLEFYDAETCDKSLVKKDNWFYIHSTFHITLDEYEFVNDDFGLRELVLLANDVGDNYVEEHFDIDNFLSEDSYYGGFYMVPIEGKVTINVYNGFAKITELYIGDELVLKLK